MCTIGTGGGPKTRKIRVGKLNFYKNKTMKKSLLGLALMVTLASGAVYATINHPVKKQPANVYTYYLEGECDIPVSCSPEYTGPICSEEFEGRIVYDAQGCITGHEVTTILGRKQL